MAIDVAKLLTVEQAENLMANARRMGREDVYQLAFARKCELEGARHDDPEDPLVKEFWMMIAAYEQLLSDKNGRRTAAARTRQKIAKDGVVGTMQSWARKRGPTMGFEHLTAAGQWKLTGEALVIKYADRFDAADVAAARQRLKEHGISQLD